MIEPNMATMLAFVATDAAIAPGALRAPAAPGGGRELQPADDRRRDLDERHAAAARERRRRQSRRCGARRARAPGPSRRRSRRSASSWCGRSPGTGRARRSSSRSGCGARGRRRRPSAAAKRIANSVLVKTALFGGDPNWGRMLQTVGAGRHRPRPRPRRGALGGRPRLPRRSFGRGRPPGGAPGAAMAKPEIEVVVDLACGPQRGHGLDLRPQLRLRAGQRRVHHLNGRPLGDAVRPGGPSAKSPATHTFRTAPAVPGQRRLAPRSPGGGAPAGSGRTTAKEIPCPKRPETSRRRPRVPRPPLPEDEAATFVASLPRELSVRGLLEVGAHFGHQTRRWDPRMRAYIFGERNGIHILNLDATAARLRDGARLPARDGRPAAARCCSSAPSGRPQAAIAGEAQRSGQFYVNNRWLGGMLTNFRTVKRVDRATSRSSSRSSRTRRRPPSSRRRSAPASRARWASTASPSTASAR